MTEPKTLVGIEARLLETLFADDQPRVRLSARETLRAALTEARDLGRAERDKELADHRRDLWLSHGHTGLYGDDGEMQCSLLPFPCDFKRDPLPRLVNHVNAAFRQACDLGRAERDEEWREPAEALVNTIQAIEADNPEELRAEIRRLEALLEERRKLVAMLLAALDAREKEGR